MTTRQQLIEKWAPILNHESAPAISDNYKKAVTALILENQQQAMLVTFFIMMIFVLMGGLYTSIDSMPVWARWFTRLNPISYFIEVMRTVAEEARVNPELVKGAPYNTVVKRLDEATAARKPLVKYSDLLK